MYLLYAKDRAELADRTRLFEQYMEPCLRILERHPTPADVTADLPEIADYLQVCRWPFRRLEYSLALQVLLDHLKPDDSYLDAGCGVTPLAHALAGRGVRSYGCDYSDRVIQGLRRLDMASVYGTPVVHSCEDLTALSYPSDYFDAISCISVLEHIPAPHDQTAVKELLRVLKPGGVLVVTVDFEPTGHSSAHYQRIRHYVRRAAALLAGGQPFEVYRAYRRRREATAVVQNGMARVPRVANECYRFEHLATDIAPLLQGYERELAVPYSRDIGNVEPDRAAAFWALGQPGKEPQGRTVLPVGWGVEKSAVLTSA